MNRFYDSLIWALIFIWLNLASLDYTIAQLSLRPNKIDYKIGFTCGFANTVVEDSFGYIWIGCYSGLYRYDHKTARAFVAVPGDSSSLAVSSIVSSFISKKYNELILFTYRGISSLNLESYHISNHLDSSNALYKGMRFDFVHQVNDTTVLCTAFDDKEAVYFLKIMRVRSGLLIEPFEMDQGSKGLDIKTFRRFYFLPTENDPSEFYLYGDKYVFKCNIDEMTIQHHFTFDLKPSDPKFENQIIVAEKRDDNRYLISIADRGLIEYKPLDNNILTIKKTHQKGENIFTMFKDHKQMIWLGTSQGNIYLLRENYNALEEVTLSGIDLKGAYIKHIYRNSHFKMLFSTSIGVFEASLNENFFSKFSFQKDFNHKIQYLNNTYLHPKEPVIFLDDTGYEYVYAANLHSREMHRTNLPSSVQSNKNVFSIYGKDKIACLHNGTIYISQRDHLEFSKWNNHKWHEFNNKVANPVLSMVADKSGYMMLHGLDWIWLLQPSGKVFSHKLNRDDPKWPVFSWAAFSDGFCYFINGKYVYSWDLKNNKITMIIDESNNSNKRIWTTIYKIDSKLILSSNSAKVFIWDLKNNTWENKNQFDYSPTNPSIVILNASMDKDSIIWYSSDYGLIRYDHKFNSYTYFSFNLNLTYFQLRNPLLSNELGIYSINYQDDIDYTLDFFRPPKDIPVILEFNSLKINNQELVPGAFYNNDNLLLEYYENNIELNWFFSDPLGLSYYTYRYRMVGLHDEFVYGKEVQPSKYLKLPPGEYQFQLEYIFDPTNEVIASKTLNVCISYPWYQTYWFFALLVISIVLVIFYFIYNKIQSVRREAVLHGAYERELLDMKLATLRMQMNPHFMFNAINSIKNYILKNEPALASRYLSKFSQLFRFILQFSLEKYISLEDELGALKLYVELEQLRISGGFEFQIHLDEDIDIEEVKIQPLLLQPFVENAIWHGLVNKDGHKKIVISIHKSNELLIVSITDNGIGREQSEKYKKNRPYKESHGIKITNSRLKSVFEKSNIEIVDLIDDSETPAGTQVNIAMPFVL